MKLLHEAIDIAFKLTLIALGATLLTLMAYATTIKTVPLVDKYRQDRQIEKWQEASKRAALLEQCIKEGACDEPK